MLLLTNKIIPAPPLRIKSEGRVTTFSQYLSAKISNIFETKVVFEKKDKKNRYDRTDFEGVYLICRLWGELSL